MNAPAQAGLVRPGHHGPLGSLDFALPPGLEAGLPPEVRGQERDQVRLLVSYRERPEIVHSRFDCLGKFLRPGDVLAINTSGTLKAAVAVQRPGGQPLELHLSTRLAPGCWVVELRQPHEQGAGPFLEASPGERLLLPGGGAALLQAAYPSGRPRPRLWTASLELPMPVEAYLEQYGFPIRYKYVRQGWPGEYYQNVYATEPGSAEMPSAGRAFTNRLMTRLAAQGVLFAPLVLHTGVASLEADELPYPERFCVPAASARTINCARAAGGRVIAVGTTTLRALQTVSDPLGQVRPGKGWTDLVIGPDTPIRTVDGLLTGLHEPRSTHLAMLLAVAGRASITRAYQAALEKGYLWHEFGDLHLIL